MSSNTAVFAFGRMSPPTIGHEKLVNTVLELAKKENAEPGVYVSHTVDKKKNPLDYETKIRFLQKAFGKVIKKSKARTFMEVAKNLNAAGYRNLIMVAGSDRLSEYDRVLKQYNGKEDMFSFDNIKMVSAGERDPDADNNDVSGISASKMRSFATEGDFESFKAGLPKKLIPTAKEIYDMTRKGMGLVEGLEDDEILVDESLEEAKSVVSLQQRRARGMKMRAMKARLKTARERQKRRMADTDRLKQRALRRARKGMRRRMSGGKNYSNMSSGEKMAVDKRLSRIPTAVLKRIALRQLPIVRRAELARLSNRNNRPSTVSNLTIKKYSESFDINEAFSNFITENDALKKHIDTAKKFGYQYNGSGSDMTGKVKIHDFINRKLNKVAQVRIHDNGDESIQTKHGPKQNVIRHANWKSVSNAHTQYNEDIAEAWDNFMTEGVRTPMNRGMMNTARKALANNAKGNIRFHGPSGTWRIHGEDGKVVKTGQKFFQKHQAQAWQDENSPKD